MHVHYIDIFQKNFFYLISSLSFLSKITPQENENKQKLNTIENVVNFFEPLSNFTLEQNETVFYSLINETVETTSSKPASTTTTLSTSTKPSTTTSEDVLKSENPNEGSSDDSFVNFEKEFISSLLTSGDPILVRVLLDNSKPENLDVFLNNSNVTLEDLEDFSEF